MNEQETFKSPEEWLKQAAYDFETAQILFETGKFIHAVFMCHLSLEKALKSLVARRTKKDPPKTHDLNYLYEKSGLDVSESFTGFLDDLNTVAVLSRYPDILETMLKQYSEDRVRAVMKDTEAMLEWLHKKSE